MKKQSSHTPPQYTVYEHLEHHVKKTTYTQRWKLLEDMNNFVNTIERLRKKDKLFIK